MPTAPGIIADITLTPQSASIGLTSAYLTINAGVYRFTIDLITTTAGTAGTATASIQWNNGSNINSVNLGSTANLAVLGSENIPTNSLNFYSSSAVNINYSVTNSGSTGLFQLRIKLEYLGP